MRNVVVERVCALAVMAVIATMSWPTVYLA